MKKHSILLVIVALGLNSLHGQFELRVEPATTFVEQFGSLELTIVLKNTGPERHIPVGLDWLNYYVFLLYRNGDEAETTWRDMSQPVPKRQPPPRTSIKQGEELSATVNVFWQEERPVFGEIGIYTLRMWWLGPDETQYFSEPFNITVTAP